MGPVFPPSQGNCVRVTTSLHKTERTHRLNGVDLKGTTQSNIMRPYFKTNEADPAEQYQRSNII